MVRSTLGRHQVEVALATYPSRSSEQVSRGEHSINLRHRIQVHHTAKPRCMDCIIREAIDIELYPDNMNWEDGFCLSTSWKSLVCSMKDRKKPPLQRCRYGLSARSRRFEHTALIRASALASPGNHSSSLHPDVPTFLRYLCSFILHRMPTTPHTR